MPILPRSYGPVLHAVLAATLVAVPALAQDDMIRQYQLERDGDAYRLVMKEVAQPVPGAQEVLVRVRAVSLNRRDLSFQERGAGSMTGLVPVGDGAGEVIALGPGVTRFQLGDRVAGTVYERGVEPRIRGAPADAWTDARELARGGRADGLLSEMIVSHEDGLVSIPDHLTFEEASTLPDAAVVAWNGLFTAGRLQPGEFVLLEGTGGVSIFGLLFSVAAGARPIITSSSDAKLERARDLGAFGTVNYLTNPEWQDEVRALTGDVGVAHVLEVGGRETFPKALEALGFGGHIAIIGNLSGGLPLSVPVGRLFQLRASVTAVFAGSREDFEAMNEFISEHQIRPVIDRIFSFDEAPAAYEYMASGRHFAKIVIKL